MAQKYLLVRENPYKGGGEFETVEFLNVRPKTQEGYNTKLVVDGFDYEFEIYSDNNDGPSDTYESNSFFY